MWVRAGASCLWTQTSTVSDDEPPRGPNTARREQPVAPLHRRRSRGSRSPAPRTGQRRRVPPRAEGAPPLTIRPPMRSTRRVVPAVVALLVVVPALAAAQERARPDTLPVRGGTWAAEGGIGGQNAGGDVGAVRFLDRRHALTLQLFGNHASQRRESERFGSNENGWTSLTTTVGWRRYGTVRRSLAPFAGVGGLIGYTLQRTQDQADGLLSVGAYGEVGAAYLATPRLALNASTGLQARRASSEREEIGGAPPEPSRVRLTQSSVALGGVRLSATLFF